MSRDYEKCVELFDCQCGSIDHVLRAEVVGHEMFVSVYIYTKLSFWRRIYEAFRYIFWSEIPPVGETLIAGNDLRRLKSLIAFAERNDSDSTRYIT